MVPWTPNSLAAGKKAGNFAESALFCENPSQKHQRIHAFADEFPTQTSREFFCQRRELICATGNSREFGAKPIRAPRLVQSSKFTSVVDNNITIQPGRHVLVWPAISAPLETASRLAPSPHSRTPALRSGDDKRSSTPSPSSRAKRSDPDLESPTAGRRIRFATIALPTEPRSRPRRCRAKYAV